MKKLLILTAVLMLTSSAVGCRCCNWLWRGPLCNTAQPAYYGGACQTYDGCDTCVTSSISPGPTSYESSMP